MAKIPRKTQKIFGSSAGATGITEYGSPASGTPVYDTDLDNIQTVVWGTGWSGAALAGTEIPTFQDFNAIHFVATNQIGYLLQEGIAEYDAGTEYHTNSIVKKTGTYEIYGSKVNANTGNALPAAVDDANWQYLGSLANLVNAGSGVYLQSDVFTYNGELSITTAIPEDTSTPQITEGGEVFSENFEPDQGTSKIRISGVINVSQDTSFTVACCLFVDTGPDAVAVQISNGSTTGLTSGLAFDFIVDATDTTARDYSIRVGMAGSTLYVNRKATSNLYGAGNLISTMVIEEIEA